MPSQSDSDDCQVVEEYDPVEELLKMLDKGKSASNASTEKTDEDNYVEENSAAKEKSFSPVLLEQTSTASDPPISYLAIPSPNIDNSAIGPHPSNACAPSVEEQIAGLGKEISDMETFGKEISDIETHLEIQNNGTESGHSDATVMNFIKSLERPELEKFAFRKEL